MITPHFHLQPPYINFIEERLKQKATKIGKQKRKIHREKLVIPMENDDDLKIIEDQGYELVLNPPGNGNCQFATLVYQLRLLGISRSAETLRKEMIRYLSNNKFTR